MTDTFAAPTATHAHDQRWRSPLARAGLTAKGVLFVTLGLLAISLALGTRSAESVSQASAIATLADAPIGRWVVAAVTVGLGALALWNLVRALSGDPVEGSDPTDRAKYAFWAAAYGSVTLAAISVTSSVWSTGRESGSGSSNGSEKAAGVIMDLPGGRFIVAGIGLFLIGYAVWEFRSKVLHAEFMERIDEHRLSRGTDGAVTAAGRAGYVARTAIAAVVGVLFVYAALTRNPEEAGGLSDALGALSAQGWGRLLLWVIAAGLVAFGLFSFVEAKLRRAG